jgi:hypothetical protein
MSGAGIVQAVAQVQPMSATAEAVRRIERQSCCLGSWGKVPHLNAALVQKLDDDLPKLTDREIEFVGP